MSSLPTASHEELYYSLKCRSFSHYNHLKLPVDIERYVDVLVEISDALGVDDLSYSSYSSAIDQFDEQELAIARSHLRMRHAEDELMQHLSSTLHEEQLIDKWSGALLQNPSDASESVPALERRKAALTAKAKEYKKELDECMADMPEVSDDSITELASVRRDLKKQEQILKEKRAKVEAFQGLPPNIELARHALQEARDQQMELIQLRERLFGKMVNDIPEGVHKKKK